MIVDIVYVYSFSALLSSETDSIGIQTEEADTQVGPFDTSVER